MVASQQVRGSCSGRSRSLVQPHGLLARCAQTIPRRANYTPRAIPSALCLSPLRPSRCSLMCRRQLLKGVSRLRGCVIGAGPGIGDAINVLVGLVGLSQVATWQDAACIRVDGGEMNGSDFGEGVMAAWATQANWGDHQKPMILTCQILSHAATWSTQRHTCLLALFSSALTR